MLVFLFKNFSYSIYYIKKDKGGFEMIDYIKIHKIKSECPYVEENCKDKCSCVKYEAYKLASNEVEVKQKLKELGFENYEELDTWELLMSMQKLFASKFHKVENLTKQEVDYWIDKYLICVEDEVREVREHLDIYPSESYELKDIKCSDSELKKELIDILHFVMDEFICGNMDHNHIKNSYLELYHPNIIDVKDIMEFAYSTQKPNIDSLYFDHNKGHAILLLVNKLLDCGGKVRQQISWKHWKKATDKIDEHALGLAFAETFKTLIDLFAYMGMTPKEIRSIYIQKNVENIFRQQLNY